VAATERWWCGVGWRRRRWRGSEPTSTRLDRAGEAIAEASDRAQAAIMTMVTVTVTTIEQLGERAARPNQVQVKFGLKFTAKGGVVVAEATLEGHADLRQRSRAVELTVLS
jgi:hypothetical protein